MFSIHVLFTGNKVQRRYDIESKWIKINCCKYTLQCSTKQSQLIEIVMYVNGFEGYNPYLWRCTLSIPLRYAYQKCYSKQTWLLQIILDFVECIVVKTQCLKIIWTRYEP